MAASVLALMISACGSGGNDANIVNEPRPPKQPIGSLVSTGEQQESIVVSQEDQGQDQGQEGQQQVHQEREPEGQQGQGEPEGQQGQGEPEGQQDQGEPEGQQQKIVVNQEENNEETPQQLTIIEEEDFPHVPPEEEEPRYSAQTTSVSFPDRHTDTNYGTETYEVVGNIGGFSYWLEDAPKLSGSLASDPWENRTLSVEFLSRNKKIDPFERDQDGRATNKRQFTWIQSGYASLYHTLLDYYESLDPDGNYLSRALDEHEKSFRKARSERIIANYNKENGFVGAYIYKGEVGSFQSDVNLRFDYRPYQFSPTATDTELFQNPRIVGTIGNDLVMKGDKFHGFIIDVEFNLEDGTFEAKPQFGYAFGPRKEQITGNPNISILNGTGTIKGALSNDGNNGHTANSLPNYVGGEVKVTGFSKNGESGAGNQLVGAFVGDKQN